MEHPAITNMMATGYADGIMPTHSCSECDADLFHDEGYVFDGERFCGTSCIVDYLKECGAIRDADA